MSIKLLTDLWEYDSWYNRWNLKKDFPGQGREGATAIAFADNNELWEYDPVMNFMNQWIKKSNCPRNDTISNRLGGCSQDEMFYYFTINGKSITYRNSIEVFKYNAATNNWSNEGTIQGLHSPVKIFSIKGQTVSAPGKIFLLYDFAIYNYNDLSKEVTLCGATFQPCIAGSYVKCASMGSFKIGSGVYLTAGEWNIHRMGEPSLATYYSYILGILY